MHTQAIYEGMTKTLEGDILISFSIPSSEITETLGKLEGEKVVLDLKKWNAKRSLNANAYAWVLFDKIAQVLRSDKDTIYKLQLSKYGKFQDLMIPREGLPILQQSFRYIDVFDEYNDTSDIVTVRCYLGSSKYDSAEMARLIDGTVTDCKDLGIETWSDEEIERLISEWKPQKEY